jgi:hypothetical protein
LEAQQGGLKEEKGSGVKGAAYHRRFFAKAWPDPDLRYLSKASAFAGSENPR